LGIRDFTTDGVAGKMMQRRINVHVMVEMCKNFSNNKKGTKILTDT
jgi:hypothetical protein